MPNRNQSKEVLNIRLKMPPPKARLHKSTGKNRPSQNNPDPQTSTSTTTNVLTSEQAQQFEAELYWCIQQIQIALSSNKLNNKQDPQTSTSTTTNVLTSEQAQQFEAELYWCIQQIQIALSSNKLNNKQVQDYTKALNTLMSNTAPMIKKRQVMRTSFGDYREKMNAEEKKAKKITMKLTAAKPNKKSLFIKKAIITPSQNTFKFDFPSPENHDEPSIQKPLDMTGCAEKNEVTVHNKTIIENKIPTFIKSDNTFRFNFLSEESSKS